MTRLADLKAEAQGHYTEPLTWHDHVQFDGSAWAYVDHHTVSVMVAPPAGCWQMAKVWSDCSEPLVDQGELKCQRNAPIAAETDIAQAAEGMEYALSATGTIPTAQNAVTLASAQDAAALDCAKNAMAQASSATIETAYQLTMELQ